MGINRKARVMKNTTEVLKNTTGVLKNTTGVFSHLSQKKFFREFAAMLPHTTRKAFVQRVYRVVAANENMVAKGRFSPKCSIYKLFFDLK